MNLGGRVLPHNREAEEAVVGGILIDNRALKVVVDFMNPEDFYVEAHKVIYETMLEMGRDNQPIDMITLAAALHKRGEFDRVGGNSYLSTLIDATPSTANIEHHAKIISNHAMARGAIYKARNVISAGMNGGDAEEAIRHYLAYAEVLRKERLERGKVRNIADVIPEVEQMYERTKRGEVGVPFPWETMTAMTLGLWPGTLTFFVARPGVGKCLHEDAEIIDPETGVPRSMREVVEGDASVASVPTWSKSSGIHSLSIDAKIDSGTRKCVKVTTRTGRSFILTHEHPLLTPDLWKRTDSLGIGASIALPAKMPQPKHPVALDPCEVDLLAVLLAEGTYTGHHTGFSNADEGIVALMQKASEWIGVDLKPSGECGYDFVRRGDTGGNPVNEVLRKHKMWRKKAVDKILPEAVYRLSNVQLASFITVFWMCDGYISRGAPEIVLASKVMLRQIQSLLLRFGVQSRVSYKPVKYDGGVRDSWRLRVVSTSFQAFYDSFSLWGEKQAALEECVFGERNPNVGFPRLPENMIERIKAISKSGAGQWRGGLHEKVAKELGRSQFHTRDLFSKSGTLKLTAFKGWCKVYGVEDEFKWLWSSDIFWDEIAHIEEVGNQKVYDLTVRPTSCFVANDVILHNSWTAVIIAWHAWMQGYKILIVSPEMSRVELGERVVARHGRLAYGDLVGATLGMFEEQRLYETFSDLKTSEKVDNFRIIDDEDRLEPGFIEDAIEDYKPDVVLVDSVYMMRVQEGRVKSGAGSKGDRMERMVSTVSWLRRTAKRTQIPVVGVSQLAREGGKIKKKTKEKVKRGESTGGLESTLAMTDTILWDVHNLFALYQDDDMKLHNQMMYVPLKVRRRAKIAGVVTSWDMTTMTFHEIGTKVESEEHDDAGFDDEIPF